MYKKNKLVYNIGINDADYRVHVGLPKDRCKIYKAWDNMLLRVYGCNPNNKTYKRGVTVCDEWLTFSNFRAWVIQQDWVGKCLDKDLKRGKQYNPENCCFISTELNMYCRNYVKTSNTGYPGIIKYVGKYAASTTIRYVKYRECFDSLEEAKEFMKRIRLEWVDGLTDAEDVKHLAREFIISRYT